MGPPCSCPLLSLSPSPSHPLSPHPFIPSSIHPAAAVLCPSLSLCHTKFLPLSLCVSLSLSLFVPETQRWMEKLLEWGAQKVVPQGEQPQLHTAQCCLFSLLRSSSAGLSMRVCERGSERHSMATDAFVRPKV